MGARACPSCRYKLSPFVLECPVCGLALGRQALPRPLLFQASALQSRSAGPVRRPQALSVPALGRVVPVPSEEAPPLTLSALETSPIPELPEASPDAGLDLEETGTISFWPLTRLELGEFLILAGLNALLMLLACLFTRLGPVALYRELWGFMMPVHGAVSWAFFMVPLSLAGQTLLMARWGWVVEAPHPERRLAYSLFHLVSVAFFPLSFACMLLSRDHRTLAELLSGQELLPISPSRLR